MWYFVMDESYEWAEVEKSVYDNPPDTMINNRARVDSEALVTLDVANIGLHELFALAEVLKAKVLKAQRTGQIVVVGSHGLRSHGQ